ncbi:hypothetical protein KEM54_006642 [Ascosphaera aggregata]|nr:hypothetical protein KEM54_006642 [Ascosphaera aggregata]
MTGPQNSGEQVPPTEGEVPCQAPQLPPAIGREKKSFRKRTARLLQRTDQSPDYAEGEGINVSWEEDDRPGFWTRMGLTWNSFKRRENENQSNTLNQSLCTRHLHMIAIGGSIGAGFFVGTGKALATSGPGSLVIDFAIVGVMMTLVVFALGEMALMFPVDGGFYTYSSRFIDPCWGFAMGWNYVMQWAIVLPLELTVAALTVNYWHNSVNIAVWITSFLIAILIINVFGVLGYGEFEFWAALLKLVAVIIFMVVAIVLVAGGGPSNGKYNHYLGAHYYYHPGAFHNGFKGFCSVFVTAAFSFSGSELVGLAAAESQTPQISLPSATKQVVWRVIVFYMLGVFFISILIPYDDKRLLGNNGMMDASASPFVLSGKDAKLIGFDSFMNVIILVSVLSIGNSGVYGGSRTLAAMANNGWAPGIFSYVDRAGRPLIAVASIISFSALAYINCTGRGDDVFAWLQALSGLAALFTWGSICLAHVRYRKAWLAAGHTLNEIPFKSPFGIWGSWIGFALNILVLVAQFYTAIYPPGGGINDAKGFFQDYLALPVVLFFYVSARIWKRTGWIKLQDIDIDTGRRAVDWDSFNAEQERRRNAPWYMKIKYFLA